MVRKTIGWPTVVTAISLIAGPVGCASTPPDTTLTKPATNHLIFNPSWTGLATFDVPRSDWPATVAHGAADEFVEYRTSVVDQQGPFHGGHDRYYRRFDSVRTGSLLVPN